MTRIAPLEPPYPSDVAETLAAMMPPGVAPIGLFRTFVQNLPMTTAMRSWGSYELGRQLSLPMREREILISRTCARCDCEYEWGVHTTFFAERAGLSAEQVSSLAHGAASDPCWTDRRDQLLIAAADALHDEASIDDALWARLAHDFDDVQLLDLMLLCGWYHAISFVANGARVPLEDGAPRFADVTGPRFADPRGRQLVSSGAVWEPVVGYSRAVRVGDWVSVAGTTATDGAGGAVGGDDIAEQTREAIRRIAAALAQVGAGLADVVRTRMFVRDISRWEEVGRAHGEFFAQIRPAASMVEISALIEPSLLVEVEAEAVVVAAAGRRLPG